MKAYFLWEIPYIILTILSIGIGFGIGTKIKMNTALIAVSPLILLALLKLNLTYFISQLLSFIVIVQLLNLQYNRKLEILHFCIYSLSIILSISLFFWIINLFIVNIPAISQIDYNEQYIFENHIVFLRLVNFTGYYRFISVFIEPGHLAMFSSFFLYASGFNMKSWYTWVFVLSILFSLSLAGYILLVLVYLFSLINQKKAAIKSSFIFSFFLLGGYLALLQSGGDEILNEKIMMRLESDEESGIAGNNRTTLYTDATYDKFILTDNRWLGYSLNECQIKERSGALQGAGYKIFLMRNGLIGVAFCLFFYLILAYKSTNRKFMMLFLLLFVVSFIQRAYPYWMAWMLPFLCTQCPRNIVSPKKLKYENQGAIYSK